MGVMANRIKPEKMRNATLSEETKDYLVAYRMVENGVDLVMRQVEEYWGASAVDSMTEDLIEKLDGLRDEILKLMAAQISQNLLASVSCTAI